VKRLDVVTVLFNGVPESPGIVSSVEFATEGEQPSLTVAFLLPSNGAHIIRSLPHESGIEAAYQWREYKPDDFAETEVASSDSGGDAQGASSTT
jgi:hypothetical protein